MRLTLITATAVMGLRLTLWYLGRPPIGTDFMLVHFLAVVTLIFFSGYRLLAQDRGTPFPLLFREGFRNAAVYALLISIFLLAYYHFVEPRTFQMRVDDLVARGVQDGQAEADIRPKIERFFTPFNYASMTFFALLAVGGVLSFVIGLMHHKVLRKLRP